MRQRREDPGRDPERLREEIALMEARLEEIGHDGDCAYERAMIRFYGEQLARRRASLQGEPGPGDHSLLRKEKLCPPTEASAIRPPLGRVKTATPEW